MNGHRRFLLVVVVAVAVIGAAGLCLVHGDADGPDLCNGLVGVTGAVPATFVLGLAARVGPGAEPAFALPSLDPVAPPPRA